MSTNNVEIQLQKAIEMRKMVQEFAEKLTQQMSNLNDEIDNYVRMGFPEDIAQKYRYYYFIPDNEIISQLSQEMLKEHIAFLDNVIVILERAINRK